jgi:hypothetical protein
VDAERELVHDGAVGAGGVQGVLLAAALLETGEGAVLASGVDEGVAARVDLGLAAPEIKLRRVLGALRALDVGLHGEEVGAGRLGRSAAVLAGEVHALGGSAQLLLADAVVGDARGELLGRALLGALTQGTDALEAELEGAGAHETRDRRRPGDLKSDAPAARRM